MNLRIDELRKNVLYSISLSKGWLSPAEKLYSIHSSDTWQHLRSRDQVDLLMAAGCYEEAIPKYEAFSHWRKVGDAYFATGNLEAARGQYQRGANEPSDQYQAYRNGPDRDRLIAVAAAQGDWAEIVNQIRLGQPEPFGTKDVIFGGSSRSKSPLLKLFAHASAAGTTNCLVNEFETFLESALRTRLFCLSTVGQAHTQKTSQRLQIHR